MTMTIKVGSLFAGIGGFDLGFERAGMQVVWQCEIDPYAQKVLRKHWPNVKLYEDITKMNPDDVEPVDVLCGGFPCQDISTAGKGVGIVKGETRSGLFYEIIRLASVMRPRWIVLENVAALLIRGMDTVLRELAQIGYDAEWSCISASDVGAPHLRKRIWIVANAESIGLQGRGSLGQQESQAQTGPRIFGRESAGNGASDWEIEPDVGRVAHGIPSRAHRLRCLGNAIVPQIAEWIGKRIIENENILA